MNRRRKTLAALGAGLLADARQTAALALLR